MSLHDPGPFSDEMFFGLILIACAFVILSVVLVLIPTGQGVPPLIP